MARSLKLCEVHGKPLLIPQGEIGLYFDLSGLIPQDYRVSSPERLVEIANSMSIEKAFRGAREMLDNAHTQLKHPDFYLLPKRFQEGVKNSYAFYYTLLDALRT